VFEGRHAALRKPVAIKVLHEHLTADRSVVARFAREGRTAAQLRHPHSLDVLDVGEERGVAFLVMELLDGTNLDVHLRERGVLPLEEALKLIFPTAAALSHAHGHGVIHRDVKPGNIFLARDARGTLVPKLVDFGISKLMDAPEGAPLTTTNDILGTVKYMAPEQTTGSKYATAKSDQYSLAAVLYECVTGRAPFTADGFYELLEAVRSAPLEAPSASNPQIPAGVDNVLLRALEREPLARFSSVRAFAAELLPFASATLADSWRRDFVESTGSGPLTPPVRSSKMLKAVRADAREEPGVPRSEPRGRAEKPIAPSGDPRTAATLVRAEAPAKTTEWHLPFPKPREQIEDARHFRSTWLTASQATLRGRGFWDKYEAALDPALRAAVLAAVPGVWLPMDVARAHYTACDTLALAEDELVEIGRSAMRRANATTLSLVSRMAQNVGVTPWAALAQSQRFWSATCDGGSVGVAKLGPKEARAEFVGYPLAALRYNRVTMRGILVGTVELFCQKVYVKEMSSLCDRRTLVMKLSWV
jgi:serine/threonine protein kinase